MILLIFCYTVLNVKTEEFEVFKILVKEIKHTRRNVIDSLKTSILNLHSLKNGNKNIFGILYSIITAFVLHILL